MGVWHTHTHIHTYSPFSLTLTHTLSHSHTLTLSLSHSHTLFLSFLDSQKSGVVHTITTAIATTTALWQRFACQLRLEVLNLLLELADQALGGRLVDNGLVLDLLCLVSVPQRGQRLVVVDVGG